ncbi:Flp family type IVb pilin [Pelagibacterium halotolerans]|uniref:Flp family type IVb pilin n=1 Tax=Pelagibacterium halotolerans TaxID=531813 RepID=UPI00384D5528
MMSWRERETRQSDVAVPQQTSAGLLVNASGATAVEYALIAALLSIVVVASVLALGNPIEGLFGGVAEQFTELEINQD